MYTSRNFRAVPNARNDRYGGAAARNFPGSLRSPSGTQTPHCAAPETDSQRHRHTSGYPRADTDRCMCGLFSFKRLGERLSRSWCSGRVAERFARAARETERGKNQATHPNARNFWLSETNTRNLAAGANARKFPSRAAPYLILPCTDPRSEDLDGTLETRL